MAPTQPASGRRSRRGLLARPLDALLFLLPLLAFCEFVAFGRGAPVIAYAWINRFLDLFGSAGHWAPALAVVVILLTTHAASGEPWRIHWRAVGWMYVEALALALPLILLSWLILLSAGPFPVGTFLERLAQSMGAGIFEELLFRLVLMTAVVIVGTDLLRLDESGVAVAAVALSALAFSLHHHPPIGAEPFEMGAFVFRLSAGAYLAAVFWFRGYGPAAGCHAAYNAAVLLLAAAPV
jgi:hypothetical protein